jgi:hypothetical protein
MRTLFIPLAKLLGIYEIFWALTGVLRVTYHAISGPNFSGAVFTACGIYSISVVPAVLLIWKAEAIADILRLPGDETERLSFDFDSVLRAGLLLIGVAVLISGLPVLVMCLITLPAMISADEPGMFVFRRSYTGQLYSSIVKIAIGFGLIFFHNQLAQLLGRQNKLEPENVSDNV